MDVGDAEGLSVVEGWSSEVIECDAGGLAAGQSDLAGGVGQGEVGILKGDGEVVGVGDGDLGERGGIVELLCEVDIDGAGGVVGGTEFEELFGCGLVDEGDELFDGGCEGEVFYFGVECADPDLFLGVGVVGDACVELGQGGLVGVVGLGVCYSGVEREFEGIGLGVNCSRYVGEGEPSHGRFGLGGPVVDSCVERAWFNIDLEGGLIRVSDFGGAVDSAFEPHGREQGVGVCGFGFGASRDGVYEQRGDGDVGCFDRDRRQGLVIGEDGVGFDGGGPAREGVEEPVGFLERGSVVADVEGDIVGDDWQGELLWEESGSGDLDDNVGIPDVFDAEVSEDVDFDGGSAAEVEGGGVDL